MENCEEKLKKCQHDITEYKALLNSLALINSSLDLPTVLDYLMELAKQVTGAEAASAILVEEDHLMFVAASGMNSHEIKRVRLERDEGIAGWVIKNQKSLNIADVSMDERFSTRADKSSGFLTKSILAVPLKIEDRAIGVLEAVNKAGGASFEETDFRLLSTLANSAAMAIHKAQLYSDLNELFISTVKVIANAIEAKDKYLHGHSERIRDFSVAIARELGCNESELRNIELAALLHDVGKIGIPEAILTKNGRLTEDETRQMNLHPSIGADMLSSVKQLNTIIPSVRYHQERFDGKGYPEGISGSDIPLSARIIAVADTFDAMTSDRTYRAALADQTALAEVERCSGTQFDPQCVRAFFKCYQKGEIISNWQLKKLQSTDRGEPA
ncbi:MAG: hypothetical protein A2293_16810 [Elusimicrobia bacterium RIFOXYB2_FULL_49_7]|nr:MAG: hypothetical protein A2293_16810 [Elusimicrobia bacterium RIFOXYB2_FULL_49_7]